MCPYHLNEGLFPFHRHRKIETRAQPSLPGTSTASLGPVATPSVPSGRKCTLSHPLFCLLTFLMWLPVQEPVSRSLSGNMYPIVCQQPLELSSQSPNSHERIWLVAELWGRVRGQSAIASRKGTVTWLGSQIFAAQRERETCEGPYSA